MLTIENLKEYCRTCLIKLEKSCNSISLQHYPYIQRLILICLSNPSADEDSVSYYTPFICNNCFEKWTDFVKLHHIAIKADEKIKIMLKKEGSKVHFVFEQETEECSINSEPILESCVEQYDTQFPFLTCAYDVTLEQTSMLSVNQQDVSLSNRNEDDNSFSSENEQTILISNFENEQSHTRNNYTFRKSLKNRHASQTLCESRGNNVYPDRKGKSNKKERYQCEKCKKYFWERKKYDGHIKQVHEGIQKPYKCQKCDKSYNLYKTLLQHNREHHKEKFHEVFKCEKCDQIFKTAVILKQHFHNKHSEQKELIRSICDKCGFIAAHQYSLTRHIINKHTETDQIKCDQCPKVFKTRYSLKYHVLGNHNLQNNKPFKCSDCKMAFTRKSLLNQHKQTHLKYAERMKCDFEGCEVRFVRRRDKTHHMRLVHLKIKQHICDFCGEAFGAMQTMRHHRFIHTGEKPYKCNVCGQGFRQRTAMKTHGKTHVGKELEGQDLKMHPPETTINILNT